MLRFEIPDLVNTFWIPVAGIVPTIAIALVLEARFLSGSWTLERRWSRSLQAALWYFCGIALFAVEAISLYRLSHYAPDASGVMIVTILIVIPFAVMILLPILGLATRGTLDAPFNRWVAYLISPRTRRRFKEVKSLHARVTALEVECRTTLEVDLVQAWEQSQVDSSGDMSAEERQDHTNNRRLLRVASRTAKTNLLQAESAVKEVEMLLREFDPRTKILDTSPETQDLYRRQILGLRSVLDSHSRKDDASV